MPTQNKWGPLTFLTTLAVLLILITLWQYKEIVGAVLLVLLIAGVVVALRSQINEQWLRHLRYQPQQEEPLLYGALPPYLQQGAQYSHDKPLVPSREIPLHDDIYRHEPEEVRD